MSQGGQLRIGELSRRSGVSPELLRAWERRYGLLRPMRSRGGLRLYSPNDVERVHAMRRNLEEGLGAAEAAALATRTAAGAPPFAPTAARRDLAAALAAFDEPRAHAVLDGVLGAMTLDAALSEVVLPYLHELGERWAHGEATVAEEHFASGVVRGRLLALSREWDRGLGPRALLACAPGELHDLGLVTFGLALRARGWRIGYLGADTPVESATDAARAFAPAVVVVSAVTPERFRESDRELRKFSRRHKLGLGGAGAAEVRIAGAVTLSGDAVAEAERLTELVRAGA